MSIKLTNTVPLAPDFAESVLRYLSLRPNAPTHAFLAELVNAYVRTVPWETVSRIARRARTAPTADCPRWPFEFWREAMEQGSGGTCYESNYAFFSLLSTLGFEGYLTLNNMGDVIGCHTAIVVYVSNERWLVDVGMPLYTILRLDPERPTSRQSPFHKYTLHPLQEPKNGVHQNGVHQNGVRQNGVRQNGEHHYDVERDRHPKPNCFTLIDQPIDDASYREATTNDYGPSGLFLEKVIIHKVIENVMWRFSNGEQPLHLEAFPNGKRVDHQLDGDIAARVAEHFSLDASIVRVALDVVSAQTEL